MKFKRIYIIILGLALLFFPYFPISADESNDVLNVPLATQRELQQAINGLGVGGGEIWLSQDIKLSSTLYFPEDNSVTIDGRGHKLELAEGIKSRHMSISAKNNKITLKNLTLAGSGWGKVGGGLSVNGKVELINCTIENNFAPNGGGIIIAGGTVVLKDSLLQGNGSHGAGGGIHMSSNGTLAAYDTRFEANKAAQGGAVYVTGGNSAQYAFYTENSEFSGNKAVAQGNDVSLGGAIAAEGENTGVKLLDCKVFNNSSDNLAGGVYAGGMLEAVNSEFSGNTAAGNGGGAYVAYKALLEGGSLSGNSSKGNGGGLFIDRKALNYISITDTAFSDNKAMAYISWDVDSYTDESAELYALLLSSETVNAAEYTRQGGEEANVFNDADISITAKTTVSFAAGGGKWQDGSTKEYTEPYYLGDKLRLPGGLSKDGKSPRGWQDANGKAVGEGYRVTGPATFYPKWQSDNSVQNIDASQSSNAAQNGSQATEPPVEQCQVIYSMEGSDTTRTETADKGSKLNEPMVYYDGFRLKGWYVLGSEQKWDFDMDTIDGDIQLEARWEPEV